MWIRRKNGGMTERAGILQTFKSTFPFTDEEIQNPERWRNLFRVTQTGWERARTQHCTVQLWLGTAVSLWQEQGWSDRNGNHESSSKRWLRRSPLIPYIHGLEWSPSRPAWRPGFSITRLHSTHCPGLSASPVYRNSFTSIKMFPIALSSKHTLNLYSFGLTQNLKT